MYSTARIFGHPIHPMLIGLPIGAYLFSLVCGLLYFGLADPFWFTASYWLAITGVGTALLAAIPGLVDLATIPNDAQAKSVGIWHMILQVTNVVLFFVAWLMMGGFAGPITSTVATPLVLQAVGALVLAVAGWLGWEMVYRHHVAIEHVTEEEERIVDAHERRRAA